MRKRLSGFTLVELLVVMGIVLILVSLLLPAIAKARAAAKRSKAIGEIKQLETAFKAYQGDYFTFPDPGTPACVITAVTIEVLDLLAARVVDCGNPRKIPYFESSANDTNGLVDPWGHQYMVVLDVGGPYDLDGGSAPGIAYDNKIELDMGGLTGIVYRSIAIWSYGRRNGFDGTETHPRDDLKAWQF